MASGQVYIGTSGWVYKHWKDVFYPKGMGQTKWLDYFVTQFSTLEVNATFYRLPTEKTIQTWADKAPNKFVFVVKGSRFITHIKRLKDIAEPLAVFIDIVSGLGNHLGPILWQLPPSMKKDVLLLKSFLEQLPNTKHAIEFRHPSWFDKETFDLLKSENVAVVWISSMKMPMNFEATADFIYLRFHGLADGFSHNYTKAELDPWAEAVLREVNKGKNAYVFFNNDEKGRAPKNARTFRTMLYKFAVFSEQRSSN